jgi:hypothetical protein
MKILFGLSPPFICLVQYFLAVMFTLTLIFVDWPWIITIIIVLFILVCGVMLPFWYKTFFDRTFVGLDRPLWIQWSDDSIRFRGVFFEIEVPIKNVIGYKMIGFKIHNMTFTLKVTIRKINGDIESMWLSTTMPRKQVLIDFLDSKIKLGQRNS